MRERDTSTPRTKVLSGCDPEAFRIRTVAVEAVPLVCAATDATLSLIVFDVRVAALSLECDGATWLARSENGPTGRSEQVHWPWSSASVADFHWHNVDGLHWADLRLMGCETCLKNRAGLVDLVLHWLAVPLGWYEVQMMIYDRYATAF